MAKVIGQRTRGRKKEALRLACEAIAHTVKSGSGEQSVTVEFPIPEGAKKGTKAETVEYSIPKGSVLVPFNLTSPKKDENVREQMRLGAKDADKSLAVRSTAVELDSGDTVTIWHFEAK